MSHDPVAQLARLAVRSGLVLGGLASGRADEFRVLLCAAALRFTVGTGYTEAAVNEQLKEWLMDDGAMVATDHVELRRWLVDTGLLLRDGFGRRYERANPPRGDFAEALQALQRVDLAAVVRNARAVDAAEREARRARFKADKR